MRIKGTYILIIIALLIGCVKPYDFDQSTFEKVLVIDGLLTDKPGSFSVKIGYTYPLKNAKSELVTDAQVWVEDQDGNKSVYAYQSNGTYFPDSTIKGELGNTYQLFVQLKDGTLFNSSQELLIPSPLIDSIYDRYAELPSEAGDRSVGGIQFFIDTHDDSGKAKYFRYEWEEGYRVVTPYPARYEVLDDSTIVPMQPTIGICYLEGKSNSLIIGGTTGFTQNRLSEFPINFVSVEQQQLRSRYALLVRQFALSEAAYLFYKQLELSNKSGGSLFDRQNGSIFGNMVNSESGDPILGYFEVSGVSEKRQFFTNGELDPKLPNIPFRTYCSPLEIIYTTPDSAFYYVNKYGGNIFDASLEPPGISIHTRSCTDCSYYASVIPPSYWVD